jgi:signal peptidase I
MRTLISSDLRRLSPRQRDAALLGLAIVAGVLLGLGVHFWLLQPFSIPSHSMAPTLERGDLLLVDKSHYHFADATPQAGDVIVFDGPGPAEFVKRVIATAGDRVALRHGRVMLNGLALPCPPAGPGVCIEQLPNRRSYLVADGSAGPLADFAEIRIPPGHLFVLGDNRGNSADSRLSEAQGGVGLVSDDKVIGRALRVALSLTDDPAACCRWDRLWKAVV